MAAIDLEQLGRYRIEAELGRGAMGVVYRARDPVLDRTVALKTISLDQAGQDSEEYRKRFFIEAKATARLNHPALITIYDFGEENALVYMAMELLPGSELGERLSAGGMEIAESVTIIEQVAEGLAYAHDNGVVHRDIKPGNIMVLPRGRAKIMDFGIARLRQADHQTQLGTRLGTPRYMSPEQIAGGELDHRTDIFSLGIVLYEMLTGGKLFHGDDLTQVMNSVATFVPPPPSRFNPEVTPLLDLVVMRALQKKSDDRYASAWEMVDDLRQCRLELAPAIRQTEPEGQAEPEAVGDSEASTALEKTQVLKPQSESTHVLRRLATPTLSEQSLLLSRRFNDKAALDRLRAPQERDHRRLARPPRAPSVPRRLWYDRAGALMALGLGLGGAAALLILFG